MIKNPPSRPKKKLVKIVKTEVLQVRLDPLSRFTVEVAAKLCNKSVSSYIEAALRLYLKELHIPDPDDEEDEIDIRLLCKQIWSPDDATKFVNTAQNANYLLSDDEKAKWKFIDKEDCFWKYVGENRKKLNLDLIKASWELFEDFESNKFDRKTLLDKISQQLRALKVNEKKKKELVKLLKEIWTEAEGVE